MGLRWRRPIRRSFLPLAIGLYAVAVVMFALFHIARPDSPGTLYILAFALAVPIPALVLLWMRWADVMDAVSTMKWAPAPQVLQELERVLREEGIHFTKVTPDGKRGFYDVEWEEVYELDGGLLLNVLAIKRLTRIFLGPVGKDNREEAERLKRLIERGLE